MTEQDAQVELYVNAGSDELNAVVEQTFSSSEVEAVVTLTLQEAGVTQPVVLTLLITDDATIQDMNKQYRGQNKPTDVLSFPLLDKPLVDAHPDQLWVAPEKETSAGGVLGAAGQTPIFVTPPGMITNLGDIVISWPTVLRQAPAASHSLKYELLYLLSHGVLHLVGYDDANEAGYQAMVRIQESVLQSLGQQVQ